MMKSRLLPAVSPLSLTADVKRPVPLPAWRNSSSTPCPGNKAHPSLFSIAMLSRNQIRQTALQYLYAASQTPETEQEGIWDILMEPFRGDYCKLKAKAVSGHLTRDYPDKLRLFITRARETADKLQQDPLTLPVRDQLQDLLTKEGEFNAALLRLKKALHEDPANDKGSLSAACDAAQELNTALMQMRRRLLDTLKDFPAYNAIWPSLISSCRKLQEINDRINCLIHPDDRPSLTEIKKVVEAGRDADELYREAKTLGEDILRRRDGLDAAIDSTLENYSPERVSAIDRAILRLGAYELLHRKDLPAPIVISEAIRLSERFSSAESPRFVNGVLAGISKTQRPA
ncbi:transcription antitermination factor NusB [Akkermansia muciniphila]|nr:transcription antitermination factor NusB [Akkermansia muciniphila]